MLLPLIFIALAATCNAVMDTVDHHQGDSIFSAYKNQIWWNSDKGWLNKYIDRVVANGLVKWNVLGFEFNKPVQISDSWHFFKTLMIIFNLIAIVTYSYQATWYMHVAMFFLYGFIRNKTFSLFYDKLLIK